MNKQLWELLKLVREMRKAQEAKFENERQESQRRELERRVDAELADVLDRQGRLFSE